MRNIVSLFFTMLLLFSTFPFIAQEVNINENGDIGAGVITDPLFPVHLEEEQANFSTALIYSKVLGNQPRNDIGIWSICKPFDNFGTAGFFQGGQKGLVADVVSQFNGTYFGVETRVNGGSGTNYGIHARASGSGSNYAVYGEALNGGINYGGYFEGKGYFSKDLILGDIPGTTFPLTIRRNQSDFLGTLVLAEVLGSEATQDVAITGISKPLPGFGTGGVFEGGSTGVFGTVTPSTGGVFEGVQGSVSGGSGTNYGIRGSASGTGTNYGIHGSASGTGENWGGYFEGKGYFSDSVGIGTDKPGVKFTVDGGSDASLSGGGYIMTNSLDGTNVVIDNNEIMARNNGSAASLWINNEGGNVGINLSSASAPKSSLHVRQLLADGSQGIRLEGNLGSHFQFTVDDTTLFFFNSDNVVFPASYIEKDGDYITFSDLRVKKNIFETDEVLSKINALSVKYYHSRKENDYDKRHLGFLAQDVLPLFPELVSYQSKYDLYGLNYSGFGVIAIKGIQELDEENQQLKKRIAELEESQKKNADELHQLKSQLKEIVQELKRNN